MQIFCYKLSKLGEIVFCAIISIAPGFVGAFSGAVLGALMSDMFFSREFELFGRSGYEATGTLGFWIGMVLLPILFISYIFSHRYPSWKYVFLSVSAFLLIPVGSAIGSFLGFSVARLLPHHIYESSLA